MVSVYFSGDPEAEAEFLTDIPRRPQHQGSTDDQLRLLHLAAIRLGLYDADDFLVKATNPVANTP